MAEGNQANVYAIATRLDLRDGTISGYPDDLPFNSGLVVTGPGSAAKLVAGAGAVSHAQKAMLQISNFLIVVAVCLTLVMVAVKVYHDIVIARDWGLDDALGILQFVLVLMVASIPVAMVAASSAGKPLTFSSSPATVGA